MILRSVSIVRSSEIPRIRTADTDERYDAEYAVVIYAEAVKHIPHQVEVSVNKLSLAVCTCGIKVISTALCADTPSQIGSEPFTESCAISSSDVTFSRVR